MEPRYETFGVEESEDSVTVLQVDEERGFFDYVGKVVVEDEEVVFYEFQEESHCPVITVYTEPYGAEERVYSATGELIKNADVPEDEIKEFLDHLFVAVRNRVDDF